jgi:hypothetical protein
VIAGNLAYMFNNTGRRHTCGDCLFWKGYCDKETNFGPQLDHYVEYGSGQYIRCGPGYTRKGWKPEAWTICCVDFVIWVD